MAQPVQSLRLESSGSGVSSMVPALDLHQEARVRQEPQGLLAQQVPREQVSQGPLVRLASRALQGQSDRLVLVSPGQLAQRASLGQQGLPEQLEQVQPDRSGLLVQMEQLVQQGLGRLGQQDPRG